LCETKDDDDDDDDDDEDGILYSSSRIQSAQRAGAILNFGCCKYNGNSAAT